MTRSGPSEVREEHLIPDLAQIFHLIPHVPAKAGTQERVG